MSSTTPWFVGAVVALVVSFVMTVEVQGATAVRAGGASAASGITLATSGNTVSLSADASAGDVTLTATNATLTVECGGCSGITGQGTSSVLIPAAGNDLSDIRITLTPTGTATPGLIARQGGATASVSVGTSVVSNSGSVTVTGGSASAVVGSESTQTGSSELLHGGGLGLFVFAGGTFDDLPGATGCPASRLAIWAADPSGSFVLFVPGTLVEAVNRAFRDFFAGDLIPANTPLVARCG